LLKELAGHPFAIVMYEAPHRIRATLIDIAELMGDRPVAIGRELTKAHEQLAVRPISDWVKEPPRDLGEIVLAIGRAERGTNQAAGSSSPSEMAASFDQLTNRAGVSRREALRRTANQYGVSVRAVYQAVEQSRKLVK
jgi:16S rRNA (cytidine1402-2'-O)-methyltransferase